MTRQAAAIDGKDDIAPDAPLRLEIAARLAFPFGGMTAAGLRKERDRDNLIVERIAGKEYTTLAAIAAMREKCRNARKALVSTSKGTDPHGSSETAPSATPLVAALASVEKLKESLPNISQPNTAPLKTKAAILPKLRSRT